MNIKFWESLSILRLLAASWGLGAMVLFIFDFFSGNFYATGVSSISLIYGAILAFYVGSKEYRRWRQKNHYPSKHWGEIYVISWTILMVIFVVLSSLSGGYYKVPGEFAGVYLTVMSVFILSRESKHLKKRG